MPRLFVLKVDEFAGLIESARQKPACTVIDHGGAYAVIESTQPITFVRREIGAGPAIWYSAFSGGIEGRLVDFGRDQVTLVDD